MKRKLLLIFVILFGLQINAQKMPTIKVGDERLGITSLDVNVEVVGNVATTTYDMLFYNPTKNILEGELNFPLGEGQNVSRLALDVNGKLREAVVVEKELGRVAFEAVVRRGVDPILLEKGTGNNYKARIYPIFRKSHKRVILAYEQELIHTDGSHYFNLPLGFKKNLDEFSITMKVYGQEIEPKLTQGKLEDFQFAKTQEAYVAKFSKKNHTPGDDLTIKIPQKHNVIKSISHNDFIYMYQTLNAKQRQKPKPNKITLFWDTSLSMSKRDIQKELNLLDSYLSYLRNVSIEVVKFSNDIKSKKSYKIINGNWTKLKQNLLNSVYDGGTSYNCLLERYQTDEMLVFTDGMNNLSDFVMFQEQPIYIINSIIMANHAQLNQIAESSNGKYINIKNKSINESVDLIKYQPFKFLGVSSDNKSLEIFPNQPKSINSDFSITAKNFDENDELILRFGFGNEVTTEQIIKLTPQASNKLVERFWAQKKLDVLENDSQTNKENIISHSKKYNLVSSHTSLIVLESVWDYVKYKITPPEELLEEYNRIINRNNGKNVVAVQPSGDSDLVSEQVEETLDVSNNNSGNISGIITDSSGFPLPGVNVIVKGTTNGTQTDFDGNYSINARSGDVLVFSYVGLTTLETTVASSNTINIPMQEDAAVLDEVVVTAQGIKREKKALGYAVSEVSAEEIEQRTEGDVARVLSGKASGVQITSQSGTSGSATNVVIRGYTSISGSNQALFVVDGVPFSNDTNSQGNFANGNVGSSRFLDLDPNNIASVNVLKGLAAATLYGTAGRNGVIVITTKSSGGPSTGGNYSRAPKKKKRYLYRGSLRLKKQKLNTAYLRQLSEAKSAKEAYHIYLKQREEYKSLPAYFIDVYDFFQKFKRETYGEMILSNIAEIDFDNYELLRVYAYKLEEIEDYGLASYIYSKVLELRPEDVQSYRDLALAYQHIGMSQESFELLNSIISEEVYNKQGRRKFDGLKAITKNEINNLMQNNDDLNSTKLDNTMRIKTQYDLRVVIDWNHNDTDIDLHVIDPFLEECSYKNRSTIIGGELTKDMTAGFGPEEFTLRNAKKGEYFVKVNYYGDRYQKIENPTFMKVTIFKNFGKPNETKEVQVVRLTKRRDNLMVSKIVF